MCRGLVRQVTDVFGLPVGVPAPSLCPRRGCRRGHRALGGTSAQYVWLVSRGYTCRLTLSCFHPLANYAATQKNGAINEVQKKIAQKKKVRLACPPPRRHGRSDTAWQAKENADDLLAEKAIVEKEKQGLIDAAADLDARLKLKLNSIGNVVYDKVPVSDNEDNNTVLRTFCPEGVTVEKRECLSHHEVLTRLDGVRWPPSALLFFSMQGTDKLLDGHMLRKYSMIRREASR